MTSDSGFVRWFEGLGSRFQGWCRLHWSRLGDPETLVGLFIMTLWTVLAGFAGGVWVLLFLVLIGWLIHAIAVESGNHVLLWFSTACLLVFIVIASEALANGLAPIPLAVAGATALGHNELVRINYLRRRNASIDEDVFMTSTVSIAAASAIGLAGVALIELLDADDERTWLWVPAAVGALLIVGFAIALLPARRAEPSSRERWEPGKRIPPQPLAREDLDRI